MQVRQEELGVHASVVDLDVCQVLADAGIEVHQSSRAEGLPLTGDGDNDAALLHGRKVALDAGLLRHELVGLAYDPFMYLPAREPGGRPAVPVVLVVPPRCRSVSDPG